MIQKLFLTLVSHCVIISKFLLMYYFDVIVTVQSLRYRCSNITFLDDLKIWFFVLEMIL